MKGSLVALALALALASASAFAEEARKLYVGASAGPSKMKGVCDRPDVVSCSNEDTAAKLFLGYEINRNFALELAYGDLGSARVDQRFQVSSPFGPQTAFSSTTYDVSAFDLAAVGSWPVTKQIALYGKLGIYVALIDRSERSFDSSGPMTFWNGDWTFGAGTRFDLTDRVGLRFEWQRYQRTTAGDIDTLSAGALFRF